MTKKLRCAIYTRKSSDEGLDQEFNSLDAQYEACAAYVQSQKHEGWRLLSTRFDDGGISGGTLARPSLQALLDAVDAGHVDRIIVYKIDRLTRSLSDFAKIVDRLEAAGASFVSVTQSFNTATSMGRLTLNMLLSFAQFEREVTAERIRDKIAASKAKGLWMGGTVPLGYEPHPDKTVRGLVINAAEAHTIKTLFQLALDHPTLQRVADAADDLRLRSKRRSYASGKRLGGTPMSKGQIHHILTNPLYVGRIAHKDKIYPGQHEAIIDQDLWERVQAKLSSRAAKQRGTKSSRRPPAPLKGKLFDQIGDHLTPSHTQKNGKIHRYYVSNRLIGKRDPSGWRLPAKAIETAVGRAISARLAMPEISAALIARAKQQDMQLVSDRISALVASARSDPMSLCNLIERVDLSNDRMALKLNPDAVFEAIGIPPGQIPDEVINFKTPLKVARRGVGQSIVIGGFTPAPNQDLLTCLAKAHKWTALLKAGHTLNDIATKTGDEPTYIRKRICLASLSPRIQKAITRSDHPQSWTIGMFIRMALPLDWVEQDACLLGE